MEQVSFTQMKDGTAEDYALLGRYEDDYIAGLADRVLSALDKLQDGFGGYKVTRFEHSLQSATRAERAGKSDEYVVAALLHDTGDELAPWTHGEMVAAILKPFVAPEICWVVEHHGAFQVFHYGPQTGLDPNVRDRWRDHPQFDAAVEFCEHFDQNCFDPDYDWLPIEHFEPMVRRVFAEPRYLTDGENYG
jgi:predicted HD phosphohydrolase